MQNPRDRADAGADDPKDAKETFVTERMRVKDGIHQNSKAWEMLTACLTERQESSEHVKWSSVLKRVSSERRAGRPANRESDNTSRSVSRSEGW